MNPRRAFTLIELLVAIVIIGLLGALLLSAIGGAKGNAVRTHCANNLRQINLALRMYADDSSDAAPKTPATAEATLTLTGYKKLIRKYLGLRGSRSSGPELFTCPSDTFHYEDLTRNQHYVPRGLWEQPISDFSSYAFNGGNEMAGLSAPGIAGRRISSINQPAKTVMVAEGAAFAPWSWHEAKRPFASENAKFNNAKNVVGFVDGHVDYIKIYWNGNNPGSLAMFYDPPPSYSYKWSGD
ncbi:MAG TPA: prepilin-type N-terminal cleavage/methylation domain-containing protein [Verrucomicrobiae bacterium]|jgi:prepilin-type N-terminal cleavage/methylation domain-containing protein